MTSRARQDEDPAAPISVGSMEVLDTTYAPSPMLGRLDRGQLEQIRASMYEDDVHSSFTKLIRQGTATAAAPVAGRADPKLGTIEGVFLPTVQNILGVILFLRLPYITGQAGTYHATAIVAISVGSSVLTCISLSALVTNGKIAEGGPYYLLSRNLGPAAGGAIGILFYLGTVVASSMYLLGAIEVIQTGFLSTESSTHDPFPFETQMSAILLAGGLNAIVYFGVDYVKHSAFFFLAVVIMSLVLLMLGVILFAFGKHQGQLDPEDQVFLDNMQPNYTEDPETGITPDFFFLLSVFYPSVTDPLQGANLSGVLRHPSKSIPSGTLWALVATSLVYFAIVWLFGTIISHETLVTDKLVAASIAWPVAECVEIGILLSTVGAALQSLTSAPRLLAAIAFDRTVPFLNSPADLTAAPGTNPRAAVILTTILVCLPCLAGNLDLIVPFITELFLLMYTSINASCFLLAIMGGPSWRPSFRYFHWSTALFGTFYCLALMLIISWWSAIAVIFLAVLLVAYIKTQDAKRNWGDAIKGLRYNLARDQLLALENRSEFHAKNWRPQLLLVLDDDYLIDPRQLDLVDFAGQLKEGRGLLMVTSFFPSQDPAADWDIAGRKSRNLRSLLRDRNIEGFARAIVAETKGSAMRRCLELVGIGTLRPNAMLIGWPRDVDALDAAGREAYVNSLRASLYARKTLLVLKGDALSASDDAANASTRACTIDIWWVVHDGGVMLLIPHLLKLHESWRNSRLRLFTVVTAEDEDYAEVELRAKEYLERVRIPAEVIPVFYEGPDAVYRRSGREPFDSTAAQMKAKLLDELELPSTMTVAIRGPSRETSRGSTLQGLFRGVSGDTRSNGGEGAPPRPRHASPAAARLLDRAQAASAKKDGQQGGLARPSIPGDEGSDEARRPAGMPAHSASDESKSPGAVGHLEEKGSDRVLGKVVPLRLNVPKGAGPGSATSPSLAQTPKKGGYDREISDHWTVEKNRLAMARFMNQQMLTYSSASRLVVTNLPFKATDEPEEVLGYVQRMTRKLDYVLLVRGAGNEVVTAYA